MKSPNMDILKQLDSMMLKLSNNAQAQNNMQWNDNHPNATRKLPTFQRIRQGIYKGMDNFTIRLVGSKKRPNEWVERSVLKGKRGIYAAMNMTHHFHVAKLSNESCWQRIYKQQVAKSMGFDR